jgi:hypothetical protein
MRCIGAAASGGLDRRVDLGAGAWLNRPAFSEVARRLLGVATLVILIVVSGGGGWLIARFGGPWASLLVGALGLAQRNLFDHVRAVARPLSAGDLDSARAAVGVIVGRDVEALDAVRRGDSRDREPGRKLLRRRRGADLLVRGLRPAGPVHLQGGQYRRQPDRPPRAALAIVRLGISRGSTTC